MSYLALAAYTNPDWSVAVYPAAIYTHRGRAYLEGTINCGASEGVPGGPVLFDGIPAQFWPATSVRLHIPIDPANTAGVFEQFVDNGTFEVEMTASGKLWLPPDIAPQIANFDPLWEFAALLTGTSWQLAGAPVEDDTWTSESLGAYIVPVAPGDGYGDAGSTIGRDDSRVHLGGGVIASPRADGFGGGYIMGDGRYPAIYNPGAGSITPTSIGGGRQWTLLTGTGAGFRNGEFFVQDQYKLDYIYANVHGTDFGAVLGGISIAPDEMPEYGMALLGGVDSASPGIDFQTRVRLTYGMPRLTSAQVSGGLEPDLPDAPGIVWGASWHEFGDGSLHWVYYKAVVRMSEDAVSTFTGQSIWVDVYAVDQDRSDGPAGRPSERHIARIPYGALGAPVTMLDGGEEWFRIASFMDLANRNVHIRVSFGNPTFYTEIIDTEAAQGTSLGELDSAGLFGTLQSADASIVGLTTVKRIQNPASGPMPYIVAARPQADEHIDLTGAGWWQPAPPRFMAVL